jgi:voltage-gated potassium channel
MLKSNVMNSSHSKATADVGILQIAILILSLLLLVALAIDTLFQLPPNVKMVIQIADTAICGILLTDFLVRLYRADSKLAFMKWGWIDLVASIPNLDILRWGRMVRVLRVIRLLRGVRSVHRVIQMVFQNRLEGGAVSLGLMAFLLVAFSSVSVLVFEREPESNIKSAEDAIWWSIATITTVGYGDKYPVTTEGRVIGIVLMVCGVGMFAGLSGLVASLFLGGHSRKSSEMAQILARLDQMQAQLESKSHVQDPPAERNKAG